MEEITREINWNVQTWMSAFLYIGVTVALAASAWRLWRRIAVWRQGKPAERVPSLGQAARNVVSWIAGSGKMARDPYAGLMHWLILWGFIILFIATTIVFLEHQTPLHFFYGPFYIIVSLLADLGGVAFLVGLGMAVHRRFVARKQRLKASLWVDGLLGLMILIGISGFVLEAARIGVDFPEFEIYSFVGYSMAVGFRGLGLDAAALESVHQTTWVTHAAFSIAFFGLATVYFFRHVVVSILAVALSPDRATGELRDYTPSNDLPDRTPALPQDFSWKDLLDADACTTCGRCTSVCPATAADKALDPRAIVLKLAGVIDQQLAGAGAGDNNPGAFLSIADQELWDCTTCGACVHECPVDIEVYPKIIDLRRQLVEIGRVPAEAGESLEALHHRENPWNKPPEQRRAWAGTKKLPMVTEDHTPEYVYWIGCAGSYEPDAQSVTRSVVDIMEKAGIDFAVLGSECCTGDPARRMGDEELFQSYKQRNLKSLVEAGAKKIVTHCPHCLNTFRHEYEDENGEVPFEVIHHSQLIRQLIDSGQIKLSREQKEHITFHDPCYLGRHNGEYEAPRSVVGNLPGAEVVEMPRNRDQSFCCGGGGGQMWLRQEGGKRVENVRLQEAETTGAGTVATACPFCKIMFKGSSTRAQQSEPQRIKDLAELVSERMEQ